MEPDPTQPSPYNETVRAYARDLLGYLNKPGGTVPGGFTTKLFELWAKADFVNKAIIAQGWPFLGVVLVANDQGGEAAVRDIAGIPA
ncbi:hypothetical protein [Pseudarthrobacter sp. BIM B-2242]|uniref:hypothetical protein n=1 Tax=Pseudarthrobacter sp. BIM B-2242 TaxID=2772401 RepID=UPI001CC76BB4|nr:hypothetical protein [Pseudarthrobacter sp. BIM B-2242]